jgi:hypothetical protein
MLQGFGQGLHVFRWDHVAIKRKCCRQRVISTLSVVVIALTGNVSTFIGSYCTNFRLMHANCLCSEHLRKPLVQEVEGEEPGIMPARQHSRVTS